jgi:hypothetical protein
MVVPEKLPYIGENSKTTTILRYGPYQNFNYTAKKIITKQQQDTITDWLRPLSNKYFFSHFDYGHGHPATPHGPLIPRLFNWADENLLLLFGHGDDQLL